MDSRLIGNVVQRALDEMAARETLGTAADTAEGEIAGRTPAMLLRLRGEWNQLTDLQEVWLTPGNAVQEKIRAAALAGGRLAGYEPADWLAWGAGLTFLQGQLDAPITYTLPAMREGEAVEVEVTTTLKNILLTKYVQTQEGA